MYLKTQIENLLRLAQAKSAEEPYHETLEYISFSGSEFFILPVKPALDVKIDITFKSDNFASTNCLFGGRINASGSNRKMFAFWQCVGGSSARPDDGYMRADLANSSTGSADIGKASSTSEWTNIVKDGKYNYLNGVLKATQSVSEEFYDDTNTYIVLGAMSNGTESNYSITNAFVGDVAQLKIWKAGTQIADYVPALDNKMRPCLYDKVTKTFLYATKTSSRVETYDLGFKRWNKFDVDYISFTGTQYIDSGIQASYTSLDNAPVCEFEGKIDKLPTNTSNMQRFISSGESSTGGKYYQIFINWNTSGTPKVPIGFQCGSASPYMEAREADTDWHYYKYDIPNKEAFIDDISYNMTSYTSTSVSIPYNLYIGARNLNGEADRFLIGSLKYLKWSVGGQLIRDFKPSVRTYNDGTSVVTKAFMYDEVYNKAYDNAGTGSFKAYIQRETTPYTLALHDNMDIQLGTGAYINASGVVSSDTASCYTKAMPVKEGDVITLTVTGRATTSVFNKRIHAYTADDGTISVGSKGSWVSQLGFITFPIGQTYYTTQTLSVTIPSGVNYIRLSHALKSADDIILETQCDLTITRTYEVGKSVSGTPSSSALGASNCFDTGLYGTQDTTVKYIAIAYDSTSSSGQLFGSYDGTTSTSKNLTINSTGTGNTAPIRFDGQVITTPIKIPLNGFASIVDNKYGLWINDTLHGSWGNVEDFTTLTTLLILKCNNSVNVRNNGCCYCLILEKDVPVAEYIPVRNASNTSVYGLYDRVNKELNTGEGTINFNVLD
jgi:hypothetical protein